ncbi:MAG TPA: phosphoenolpyruvate synthase [Planctomycetes bacterium]|nr:phosphoenolpyruvate synthase [Planctomycetota bacterium]
MGSAVYPSTGFEHLDEILSHLQLGDNVVWQVDEVKDYKAFVAPYVERALKERRDVVYIRFAQHEPVLDSADGLTLEKLDANIGFELFTSQIHKIIAAHGLGAFYVFDCLSDLLSAWATDLMIGNFFMVTCPYLYELDTIAYFAIIRAYHSFKTVARIRGTTQLLLDIYKLGGAYYVHPLKVWNRYSPTMFLPHRKVEENFVPVTTSIDAGRLFSYISEEARKSARRKLDYWDRLFLNAEELLHEDSSKEQKNNAIEEICKVMIGRERRMLCLVKKHFTLQDLLEVKARLIGSGYIGGKAVGMLLARKILDEDKEFDWKKHLERHDSFYIGSDIFYAYIIQNGLWKLRMEQKTRAGYFARAGELGEKMLNGKFPDEVKEQFLELIEYFGQSPIIVRSSSLLEDAFGNAFAGKYKSIFLVNQGSPDERYAKFVDAIRQIYASTMNKDALAYRLQMGLDEQEEQMALLVQRVSGSYHDHCFFPYVAGVGVSYNTFVWNRNLNPEAGMLRVVLGLGTRAVDRVENDYPRIAALDDPLARPHTGMDNIRKFSQHYVDVLSIKEDKLRTISLRELTKNAPDLSLELIAVEDREGNARAKELGIDSNKWCVLTFDKLLARTDFASNMQRMLKRLEEHYNYPVDIEFTLNFPRDRGPQINLLQCRPLQTKGAGKKVEIPEHIDEARILFRSQGCFMGGSISQSIHRIIYIDPEGYIKLPMGRKYDVARIVGKLNGQVKNRLQELIMLIGPGRWGTTTPSLGVPVSFSEINNISVLCEVSYPSGNLMPELSYGSHFFQDLIEGDIFYIALFCEKDDVVFNRDRFYNRPNILKTVLAEAAVYEDIIRVYDVKEAGLKILADVVSQKIVCFG